MFILISNINKYIYNFFLLCLNIKVFKKFFFFLINEYINNLQDLDSEILDAKSVEIISAKFFFILILFLYISNFLFIQFYIKYTTKLDQLKILNKISVNIFYNNFEFSYLN